jgi:GNAT superfamily N-acetyltransferase
MTTARYEQGRDVRSDGIRIRPAKPDDAGGYLKLVDALARYEALTPPDAVAKTRLIEHLFGERPHYRLLVAEDPTGPRIVAYAAHFLAYSTFLARPTFYLEDLFVLPEYRSLGVGHRLLAFCAKTAIAEGCGRMDFLVLDWNDLALDFYARHGVPCRKDWLLHRLEGDELNQVAQMSLEA